MALKYPYLARLIASVIRDFFRFALARVITLDLTALSSAEITLDSEVAASAFFPAAKDSRSPFSDLRRREMMERLCRCLRALLRMRRSADFVFGIVSFLNQFKARNGSQTGADVNAEAAG